MRPKQFRSWTGTGEMFTGIDMPGSMDGPRLAATARDM
jgi:hypothetical protein